MAIEIVLVADPWPPFNIKIGSNQEGYIVDIARTVFEAHGHSVTYINVPWKRAISGTLSGQYTGAIGASKEDGKGLVFPDEELARNILSFYVRKDCQWQFEGSSSLANITIGVIDGYDYRKWLNDYIEKYACDEKRVQVVSGSNPLQQNLRKMLCKRIDVVVGNEAAIRYTAKEIEVIDSIKAAGYDLEQAYIYIAFSPVLPESSLLAQQLSNGIVKLRKSGQLKIILDRYGLLDWK
ncbi:amino acid ABC transporter substrate-binding protein [Desulfosarcina widdelii]|uniref:Amino acid ABC transporter substrate-binding protein n=1 Tax=Desulfosarcina widdelii TaxID=947919 RepID=A0A5K7Z235_9BACT|nr:transporter substrate-binding domain-containing protein [Desulfosarcina widdelii]BBO74720.1 amino acid ABC transporter substrate-binding protein [Desulfosarcina widdelii]